MQLRMICGITFTLRGEENIPRAGAIIACKHQSTWETLSLAHILPSPSFILKKELMRIPLLGWYMLKLGNLPIDRAGGGSTLRSMLRRACKLADDGRQIIIFPEGTRRVPGMSADYQRGIIALYRLLDVPCVPVALNSGLFWPPHVGPQRSGRITIEFLPAILPGLDGETFFSILQEEIEHKSNQLHDKVNGSCGG